MAWNYFLIFLIVSAVCCTSGFKKTVYFLSVGYGFSIAGLGLAYLAAVPAGGFSLGIFSVLQCLLLIVYGVRLSGFLLYREKTSASYRRILSSSRGQSEKSSKLPVRIIIWLGASALYILQSCPVFFRIYNGRSTGTVLPFIGIVISLFGLTLETLADLEKNASKKINPDLPAMNGLFKMVRCPNFFGETLFWLGVFIGGLDILQGADQWILAVSGYLLILMVMVSSAARLDKNQEKRYGALPEYRKYADHTPILLPLIPVCHLGRYQENENRK